MTYIFFVLYYILSLYYINYYIILRMFIFEIIIHIREENHWQVSNDLISKNKCSEHNQNDNKRVKAIKVELNGQSL